MAFQPVAATAKVTLDQTLAGQEVINTLYFRRPAAYTTPQLVDLAVGIVDWWTTNIRPSLSEDLTLNSVTCTSLDAAGGPQWIETGFLPLSGAVPSPAAPNNVAACISIRTAFIGRNFRGRNYIAGLPASVLTNSTIGSGTLNALAAGYVQLTATIAGGGWVVVTRVVDGVVQLPSALTTSVQNAFFVNAFAKTQRRRVPGVGA